MTGLLLLLLGSVLHAASIKLDGETTWMVRSGECQFTTGPIQNLSPSNTTSGTLKLVLWMSPTKFPSRGYPISEVQLGQLRGGFQINPLNLKGPLRLPRVEGTFYFTVYVAEFTTAGWQTRAYQDGDTYTLDDGNFVTGKPWIVPDKALVTPPSKLRSGSTIVLNPRATSDFKELLPFSIFQTKVKQNTKTRATLTRFGKDRRAVASYKIREAALNGKTGKAARLTLNFAKAANSKQTSKADLVLYFQSPNSGVFRLNETEDSSGNSTWGLFKLRGK